MFESIKDKIIYLIAFLKFAVYGFYLLLLELELGRNIKTLLPFLKSKRDAHGRLDKTSKKLTEILQETITEFQNLKRDDDKWVIVTGANSGIGLECVKVLAENGCNVIMACRSVDRATAAKDQVSTYLKERKAQQPGKVEIIQCDISDLESVRQFVDRIIKDGYKVNRLINNAGVMLTPFGLTKQKFETQFASNYLGPTLLSLLLLDTLNANGPSRIINVASAAHHGGSIDLNTLNPQSEKEYSPMHGYTQSKALCIMGTYKLHQYLAEKKLSNITVNALHPGIIYTNIGSNMWPLFNFLFGVFIMPIAYTSLEGAVNSLFLTLSPEVDQVSGKYFEYCTPKMSLAATYDPELQNKLWEITLNMLKPYGVLAKQ